MLSECFRVVVQPIHATMNLSIPYSQNNSVSKDSFAAVLDGTAEQATLLERGYWKNIFQGGRNTKHLKEFDLGVLCQTYSL